MRIIALTVAASVGLAGCGGLLSHLTFNLSPDAGSEESDSGDCCSVSPPDDGGGFDSGAFDAAVPPALQWSRLSSLPPASSFNGVGGFTNPDSGMNLFVTASQRIYRLQNGTWSTVYADPIGPLTQSIWASPGGLVVTGGVGGVTACRSNCAGDGGFTATQIAGIQAVCGGGSEAYAIGIQAGKGTLYHYSPSDDFWNQISTDTGASAAVACGVASGDEVFIASGWDIVRTHLAAHSIETLAYPSGWTSAQQTALRIHAFWINGSTLLAAGNHRVVLSRVNGAWTFVHGEDAGSPDSFRALAGYQPREVYAAGEGLARSSPSWEDLPFSLGYVSGAWAAGPNELFLVGSGADGGMILRGSR